MMSKVTHGPLTHSPFEENKFKPKSVDPKSPVDLQLASVDP